MGKKEEELADIVGGAAVDGEVENGDRCIREAISMLMIEPPI